MKETKFSKEILGKTVEALIIDTGAGISCVIAGGDKGHIGAASVRYPGGEDISVQFPSHREGVVADKWADAFSARFGCACVVSCGIHYDGISKEQIQQILDSLDDMLEEILCCVK